VNSGLYAYVVIALLLLDSGDAAPNLTGFDASILGPEFSLLGFWNSDISSIR